MTIVDGNWYDHPAWYDLAFQGDTALEAAFLDGVAKRYLKKPPKRLFEPGCGTGRLIRAMATRPVREIIGTDTNRSALAWLRERLAGSSVELTRDMRIRLLEANLVNHRLPDPADLAWCFCNTFRHLLTEEDAISHLRCMASSLRPGAIYALGLHLLPPDASTESFERWTESAHDRKVTVTLQVEAASRARRLETLKVVMTGRSPAESIRVRSRMTLRLYNRRQLLALLAAVPEFELLEVFDFWYELDHPLKLTDELADVVLILERR
jgi:SAM-dependent methyltransferase